MKALEEVLEGLLFTSVEFAVLVGLVTSSTELLPFDDSRTSTRASVQLSTNNASPGVSKTFASSQARVENVDRLVVVVMVVT